MASECFGKWPHHPQIAVKISDFRATHPKWRSMFVQGLKLWFNLSLLKEYDKLGKSGGKECWDACLPMNCVTFVSLFYFKLTSEQELLRNKIHFHLKKFILPVSQA
jgi:hypothetical protein